MKLSHLDERGGECAKHVAASTDELLALALVGSRAPSFHHDLASKLQGLMMAIDEISEVSGATSPALGRAIDTAHASLKEVLALLNANRALTKPPAKTRTTLETLIASASARVYVTVKAAIPVANLEISVPPAVHALALVLDVAGGPGRGRSLAANIASDGGAVTLSLAASPEPPPNAAESLALAGFVLAREGGELRCTDAGTRFLVRLPLV